MKALKKIGIGFLIITGVIVIYLAVVIFGPGFNIDRKHFEFTGTGPKPAVSLPYRHDVSFKVDGTEVSAWLYLPDKTDPPVTCVVMSNGFGGTKDGLLEKYAIRYRNIGLAVLTYDYRFFGQSKGEPRQMYSMLDQLKDLRGAVAYVRSRKEINPDKVALWGTSAGGGYGFVIAAEDKNIAAIVSHVPGLDNDADAEKTFERMGASLFRILVHAQRDRGRSRFNLSPHRIPIVGKTGALAMLNAPGAYEGYSRLAPPGFKNEICARSILLAHLNPMDFVPATRVPVLLQVAEKDNLVANVHVRVKRILGKRVVVKIYPVGHFDVYTGPNFERAVRDQIDFFQAHLLK